MKLTFKNTTKINIINLILSLIMTLSAVFGIFQLKETFSFIDMIALIYGMVFQIFMIIVTYAGIRQLNPPEFMEFLENGNVQLFGFLVINLLLIDTSFVGLIVSSVMILYSIGAFIYVDCCLD